MLSKEEQQALAGMSREELVKLWVLIQQVKEALINAAMRSFAA